mmetsp:Transcript_72070/g.187938  ORF Transcript_72070/g.187938 Transcript_72070/m.187938 type:complete len:204 (+) Transcript_72070:349-960(+)
MAAPNATAAAAPRAKAAPPRGGALDCAVIFSILAQAAAKRAPIGPAAPAQVPLRTDFASSRAICRNHQFTAPGPSTVAMMRRAVRPFLIFTTPVKSFGLLKHSERVAMAMIWGMAQKRYTAGSRRRARYSRESGTSSSASATSSLRHVSACSPTPFPTTLPPAPSRGAQTPAPWAVGRANSPRSLVVVCFFHTLWGQNARPST